LKEKTIVFYVDMGNITIFISYQSAMQNKAGGACVKLTLPSVTQLMITRLRLFGLWFNPYDTTTQSAFYTGGIVYGASE
jgi:hypothetical protein